MARPLNVELEQHDIAVLDDVFLALIACLARILGALFATQADEVVVRDGLRTDEAALEVAVDRAGGPWCAAAGPDGPCPDFLRSGGEKRNQAKERITGADKPIESGFFQAEGCEEFLLL